MFIKKKLFITVEARECAIVMKGFGMTLTTTAAKKNAEIRVISRWCDEVKIYRMFSKVETVRLKIYRSMRQG